MHNTILTVLATIAILIGAFSGAADRNVSPEMRGFVKTLQEFSGRRSLNTLFNNTQAPERGAQVGYVNTSDGSLTFARRDLVRVGDLPIVGARIYDSSMTTANDFGSFWRLSIAESIAEVGEHLNYSDETGHTHTLVAEDGKWRTTTYQSHFEEVIRTDLGFLVRYRNGWTKLFEKFQSSYLLTQVRSTDGQQLYVKYEDDLVSRIESGGKFIDVIRGDSGRIESLRDDSNREILYTYNSAGHLDSVTDVGGSLWKIMSDRNGRIIGILDPLGLNALRIHYKPNGSAHRVNVRGRQYDFEFHSDSTVVSDGGAGVTTYFFDELGRTKGIRNNRGQYSSVSLDTLGRVRRMHARIAGGAPVRVTGWDYGTDDRLASRFFHSGDDRNSAAYTYSSDARTLQIQRNDESVHSVVLDDAGRTLRRSEDGVPISTYSYNDQGELTSKSAPQNTVELVYQNGVLSSVERNGARWIGLGYGATQQIQSVEFHDGTRISYQYDDHGLRRSATWNNDIEQIFAYDSSGNLRGITTDMNGLPLESNLDLDDDNRVRSVNIGTFEYDVTYDKTGNVLSFSGDAAIEFSYDDLGRLTTVTGEGEVIAAHSYEPTEVDIRASLDDRTGSIALWGIPSPHTFGSNFQFRGTRAERSDFAFLIINTEHGVYEDRASLLPELRGEIVAESSLTRLGLSRDLDAGSFDLASNSFFLPQEMRSINCCPPVPCNPNLGPCDDFQRSTAGSPNARNPNDPQPNCPPVQIVETPRTAQRTEIAYAFGPQTAIPMLQTINESYTLRSLFVGPQLQSRQSEVGSTFFTTNFNIGSTPVVAASDYSADHKYEPSLVSWAQMNPDTGPGLCGVEYCFLSRSSGNQILGNGARSFSRIGSLRFQATIIPAGTYVPTIINGTASVDLN